jgi:hypothetical protein
MASTDAIVPGESMNVSELHTRRRVKVAGIPETYRLPWAGYEVGYRRAGRKTTWLVVADLDQARRARADLARLKMNKVPLLDGRMPFVEVADSWLERCSARVMDGTLADCTLRRYRIIVRRQLVPLLSPPSRGNKTKPAPRLIRDILPFVVADLDAALTARGLATSTGTLTLGILAQVAAHAMELGQIAYNPVTAYYQLTPMRASPATDGK